MLRSHMIPERINKNMNDIDRIVSGTMAMKWLYVLLISVVDVF